MNEYFRSIEVDFAGYGEYANNVDDQVYIITGRTLIGEVTFGAPLLEQTGLL